MTIVVDVPGRTLRVDGGVAVAEWALQRRDAADRLDRVAGVADRNTMFLPWMRGALATTVSLRSAADGLRRRRLMSR
jgi:hypothetical protein